MNDKKRYIELARNEKFEVCVWGAGYLGTQSGLKLLYKRGILVNFYCDNNSELWGKEIINGIYCISPEELQKKKENMICFLMVGCTKVDAVLRQMEHIGIKHIVLFDDLFIEEKEEYFPFMKRKRIAFYTCIVGSYDSLKEPLSISPECDYYLISDKKPEKETVFQYIDIKQYLPEHIEDNTKKNRFCKINPHIIFPQYRYSVYFDGVLQVSSTLVKFIENLPETRVIALAKNYWPGLYMEAMRVMLSRRDNEEIVKEQVEKYWLEGMPENFGSVFCGILIREHNNPVCRKLMKDWWDQVENYSKRDMISFPYVLWKNGYTINDVKTIAEKYQYETEFWKDA